MRPDDPRVLRVLPFVLCATLLGVVAVILWAFYTHPFPILVFGLPRWTAQRRSKRRVRNAKRANG